MIIRKNLKKTKKEISAVVRLYLLGIVFGLFIATAVLMAIDTGASGAVITKLENEEAQLLSANRELSAQITGESSVSLLQGKSEELGFVKPGEFVYLNKEENIAKLP